MYKRVLEETADELEAHLSAAARKKVGRSPLTLACQHWLACMHRMCVHMDDMIVSQVGSALMFQCDRTSSYTILMVCMPSGRMCLILGSYDTQVPMQ